MLCCGDLRRGRSTSEEVGASRGGVASEEAGEPRRAREQRTARGSEEPVAVELVPKNRDSAEACQ